VAPLEGLGVCVTGSFQFGALGKRTEAAAYIRSLGGEFKERMTKTGTHWLVVSLVVSCKRGRAGVCPDAFVS
jgi:hypothetical protein